METSINISPATFKREALACEENPWRLRKLLYHELSEARFRLFAEPRKPRTLIIAGYTSDYTVEASNYQRQYTPVYVTSRWWPIPRAAYFGLTDRAQLTIYHRYWLVPALTNVRELDAPNAQIKQLITGLWSMQFDMGAVM